MSGSYSRLAAIRDYWMPRDPDARAEVRVTDIDEILRELARRTGQRDAFENELRRLHEEHWRVLIVAEMSRPLLNQRDTLLHHLKRLVNAIERMPSNAADGLADEAREAIKLVEGEKE